MRPPIPTHRRSPASQLARKLGLVLVFMAVAALFWITYERGFERMGGGVQRRDLTETLSAGQRDHVESFARFLKRDFGLEFHLLVTEKGLDLPRLDARTLFIGLDPSRKRSVVVLPPLLRRSIDPSAVSYLEQEHFQRSWTESEWPLALEQALDLIRQQLHNPGPIPKRRT